MEQTIIEELLGWQGNTALDSETSSRRYYIQADNPEKAKKDFEAFAKQIPPVHGYEMSFGIDEEREADKLYFGSITFATLSPKVKYRIDDSLQELVGDKNSEGRSSASRERLFRVQGVNAVDARNRLENYIRANAVTSGRLHIDEISVDESPNGDGFYSGRATWGLPATHGPRDKIEGIVPAYGGRSRLRGDVLVRGNARIEGRSLILCRVCVSGHAFVKDSTLSGDMRCNFEIINSGRLTHSTATCEHKRGTRALSPQPAVASRL